MDSIFKIMPAPDYHAHPAMSASKLKKVAISPAHYQAWLKEPDKASDAMSFGSAVHVYCLEQKTIDQQVFVSSKNRKTKGFEEDCIANPGKVVITTSEAAKLPRVWENWKQSNTVQALLDGALIERSLFWKDQTGVECKARLDGYNPILKTVFDLKTTKDASAWEFGYQAAKLKYHYQAAMYLNAVSAVSGEAPEFFVFIVVENEAPFSVVTYRVNAADLAKGQAGVRAALDTYARCLETNTWPAYPDKILDLSLPAWAF